MHTCPPGLQDGQGGGLYGREIVASCDGGVGYSFEETLEKENVLKSLGME